MSVQSISTNWQLTKNKMEVVLSSKEKKKKKTPPECTFDFPAETWTALHDLLPAVMR